MSYYYKIRVLLNFNPIWITVVFCSTNGGKSFLLTQEIKQTELSNFSKCRLYGFQGRNFER